MAGSSWEVVSHKPTAAGDWEVAPPKSGATPTAGAATFDPSNPMAGVPASSLPVGGLGGSMATLQTAKDVQGAAQTGEKVLRTGAGIAATGATFAALAPAAAAVSLPAAIVAGMSTGLSASVARQAVEHVMGGPDKSLKERSLEAGVDTVLGGAGEVGVRTANYLLKLGGEKVLMPLIARAAARTDDGLTTLQDYGVKMMNGIRLMNKGAGDPKMSTQEMLSAFNSKMEPLAGAHSQAFESRFPALLTEIHAADGDLSKLVKVKGELSQFAYKGSGLNFEEESGLKWLAGELDRKLGATIKQVHGEDGLAVYNGLKANWEQVKKFNAGLDFTAESLKRILLRAVPAAIGGEAGYQRGKQYGTVGGIVGATAGAAVADTLSKQVAPWALQRMLTDTATGPIARQAINQMARGEIEAGEKLFRRAVAQSGIQEVLEPMVKQRLTVPPAPTQEETQ